MSISKELERIIAEIIKEEGTVCEMCGSNESEPVEVSYAFKLLIDELLGLGVFTRFDLKNKFEQ